MPRCSSSRPTTGRGAQTLEHLELLDALGIADGVAVVTKTDVARPGRSRQVVAATSAARADVARRRAGRAVSAGRGDGIAELRAHSPPLRDRVAAAAPARCRPRLAIDRVFSVKGRGVVVTGTLRGGRCQARRHAAARAGRREARSARSRSTAGRWIARRPDGPRSISAGVELAALHRGMVLTTDPTLTATDRVLVALRPPAQLSGSPAGIPADRARVRLHAGTEQLGATVGRSGRDRPTCRAAR